MENLTYKNYELRGASLFFVVLLTGKFNFQKLKISINEECYDLGFLKR